MTIGAILLAAGESSRMGSPKPLLPWGDATLIEYQLGELAASQVETVVVVLGYEAQRLRPYVQGPKMRVVVNEDYRQGPASSLRAGARALPPAVTAVVVLRVDQPRPRYLIDGLVSAHLGQQWPITVPVYQGRRGHPPVLAGQLVPELLAVTEETRGLRAVMWRHAATIHEVELGTPIVLLDINSPQDYQRARRSYFAASGSR